MNTSKKKRRLETARWRAVRGIVVPLLSQNALISSAHEPLFVKVAIPDIASIPH